MDIMILIVEKEQLVDLLKVMTEPTATISHQRLQKNRLQHAESMLQEIHDLNSSLLIHFFTGSSIFLLLKSISINYILLGTVMSSCGFLIRVIS